jgi:hypothetical protein
MVGRLRALAGSEMGRVVALLTVWRALSVGFALLAAKLVPAFSPRSYWSNFHFPPSAPPGPWIELETWDAQHYLYLAEYGYQPGEPSTAFFPLWPWAIKVVAPVVGGSTLVAGMLLANLLSIAALALLYRFAKRALGDGAAAETTLCATLCYPGALFFGFPYSEALFLLLAVAALDALHRGDWRAAGLAAFLLPLVRGIGIFVGVPMLYALWRDRRAAGRLAWRKAAWLAAPLGGLGCYLAFMYLETGSATSGMRAQGAFISQRAALDLVDLWGLLQDLANVSWGHGFEDSALDRVCFVGFAAALVWLWRADRLLFWYALPLGLLPAMTSLMSYTRYLVVAFPVFFAAGAVLAPEPRRRVRWLALGALLALQALLVVRHVNFRWAG